jgi:hypothetical protein
MERPEETHRTSTQITEHYVVKTEHMIPLANQGDILIVCGGEIVGKITDR